MGRGIAKPGHGDTALPSALDVPLRQHNSLLIAAGFAPVLASKQPRKPRTRQIRTALDFMLAQQRAFPAVAVDRHWNLLQSNSRRRPVWSIPGGPPAGPPIIWRRAGRPGRAAATPCELGRGGRLFYPQRGRSTLPRRINGDAALLKTIARL